jgi:hypothetical protein
MSGGSHLPFDREDAMTRLAAILPLALAVSLVCQAAPFPEDEVEIRLEEKHLPGLFANRTGPNRTRTLARYGDDARAQKAIDAGLRWLALHQAEDGRWGLHDYNKHARTAPLPGGKVVGDDSTPGTTRRDDVAATAFALLPLLAAGHTHKAPAKGGVGYDKVVSAGLSWLLKQQAKQGNDRGRFGTDPFTYTQALAVLAVCEAYGMTGDAALKGPAQAAVDYLVRGQHTGGGWRYGPGQAGDTSVTGFVIRALSVAKAAGLKVPAKTLEKVTKYLDTAETQKGIYAYTPGSTGTVGVTAAAALCRLLLGARGDDASVRASVKRVKAVRPSAGARGESVMFEYYTTRMLFELGGGDWRGWYDGKDGLREALLKRQDGGQKVKGDRGSWAGSDFGIGRLGATSLCLLMLQAPCRYVPLRELKKGGR